MPPVRGAVAVALLLALLAPGCQAPPPRRVALTSHSALLAVDVRFPIPVGRDPGLVQAFFIRAPVREWMERLPEVVPATFVKNGRAYLLDPEPGTWAVAAVTSRVAPPLRSRPVAGGVEKTTLIEELGHVVVLSADWIERTQTVVRPGEVAFVGDLRVRRGERINANTAIDDEIQKKIAEQIRPGVTRATGLAGMLSLNWRIDRGETELSNGPAQIHAFFRNAVTDLGASPWAGVVANASPSRLRVARPTPAAPLQRPAPEPAPEPARAPIAPAEPPAPRPAPEPARTAAQPPVAEPSVEPPAAEPPVAEPAVEPVRIAAAIPPSSGLETAEPPPAPRSESLHFPNVPPDSPLADVVYGMHHGDVRTLLGEPDLWRKRVTAKAWIPFYSGPDARLIDWIYDGLGRVVFTLQSGTLEVYDVVPVGAEGDDSAR